MAWLLEKSSQKVNKLHLLCSQKRMPRRTSTARPSHCWAHSLLGSPSILPAPRAASGESGQRGRGRVGVHPLPPGGPVPDRRRPRGRQVGRQTHLVEVRVPRHRVTALVGVAAAGGCGLHGWRAGGRRGRAAALGARRRRRCCWDAGAECGGGGGPAGKEPAAGGGRGWREGVDAAGGAREKPVSPAGQPARIAESWQEISRAGELGGGGRARLSRLPRGGGRGSCSLPLTGPGSPLGLRSQVS